MGELLLAQTTDNAGQRGMGALVALMLFIAASVWLGTLAQRVVEKGNFLRGYFLGNRGLGVWALALTATVQSGGTFMGFPSLVYSYGWIGTVFIAAYMVVPICGFAIAGKRISQISRKAGAITIPDLFRERFNSPLLGMLASVFIMVFMSIMMVAQFKAGAIVMKLSLPGAESLALAEDTSSALDTGFYIGLAVFSLTVVGYTMIGGFLAAVWTDLFQSVMMWFGVLILLGLSLYAAGGLEAATKATIDSQGIAYASGPGAQHLKNAATGDMTIKPWLPITGAISLFCLWPFSGLSSPASIVRVMAVKDTRTLRHSVVVLCLYNMCIYLPLIMICICARAVMPDVKATDEVIPRMTFFVTRDLPGGSLLAGLILAAPFGAVMATVSSYLVVIASGLVRDLYLRWIRPDASQGEIRLLAYLAMIVVGILAVLANLQPVTHLQKLVVFSTSSTAAAFLVPLIMLCYWRRANAAGAIAAMLSGVATVIFLYGQGIVEQGWQQLEPARPLGFDPMIWSCASALVMGSLVTVITPPPADALAAKFFDAENSGESR